MPAMNDPRAVEKQYATTEGLNARIALHQKYSVNKEPYDDWIASHYRIQPGERVLEVGCGTGRIWMQSDRYLPNEATLLLTDSSSGMLDAARSAVPPRCNIAFAQVDIQEIPYGSNTFDLVIANAMLYHVPDLHRALGEVARVLKPDGRFICTTISEHGIGPWLQKVLGTQDVRTLPFSLENGGAALKPFFRQVDVHLREDAFRITSAEDLAAYALSMTSFSFVRDWPYDQLIALLTRQMTDGVIHIPKCSALFEASMKINEVF